MAQNYEQKQIMHGIQRQLLSDKAFVNPLDNTKWRNEFPNGVTAKTLKVPKQLKDTSANWNFAMHLENALTPQESQALIALSEELGYSPAKLSKRKVADFKNDEEKRIMTDELWSRIKNYVPNQAIYQGKQFSGVALRPNPRFYKYEGDDFSEVHYDIPFRDKGKNPELQC